MTPTGQFPGTLSGAEVAPLTHYEIEAHVTGGCLDGFGGCRVLRAAGNDGSEP